MNGGTLGIASDFYRLRLLRLDEEEAPDLEWREDILYREPPSQSVVEHACFVVQAVDISDDEKTHRLAGFGTADEAEAFLSAAREDLPEMTRIEFEARYFPQS